MGWPIPTRTGKGRPATEWTAIRRAYETGEATVASLARQFGIASSTIFKRKKREQWHRRNRKEAGGALLATSVDDENLKPVLRRVAASADAAGHANRRLEMIARFYREIERRLTVIEHDAADPDAAASERAARLLVALARAFEKMTEYEDRVRAALDAVPEKRKGVAAAGDTGDAIDADAWRDEIARRLAAIGGTGSA